MTKATEAHIKPLWEELISFFVRTALRVTAKTTWESTNPSMKSPTPRGRR
jgi:hypothetical protein